MSNNPVTATTYSFQQQPPVLRGASSRSRRSTYNRHSSVGCNTTMDDDVFEDSDLTNNSGDTREYSGPPSGKPLLMDVGRNSSTMFPHIVGKRTSRTDEALKLYTYSALSISFI